MREADRRPRGLRARGPRRGLHGRRPARDGRLVARARGDPPELRRPGRLAVACTCSTRPTPARSARSATGVDLDKTLFLVSTKSGGTIETLSLFKHFWSLRPDGRAVRRDHRPGLRPRRRSRASTASGARSSTTPTSAGATARCRTSGSCPRRSWAPTSPACSTRAGVAEQNCLSFDSLERRTAACGSALALGELALAGRDKLTFVIDPPLAVASACGSSSSSPSRPASTARASCRSPTSRSATPADYGDDRIFLYLRHVDEPDAERRREGRGARDGRPPGHRARRSTGPTDLGRIFFFAEFAIAVAGWVLEINPFDQPNVQEAKDATSRVARAEGARGPARRRRRRAARAAGAASAPPHYVAIMGYVEPSAALRRRGRRELRAAIRDATQVGDDVRLRPALPALDRPAPQGRPADRALPAARPRLRRRTSRSRAPTTASRGSSTPRPSATSRRCARTTCRRSG